MTDCGADGSCCVTARDAMCVCVCAWNNVREIIDSDYQILSGLSCHWARLMSRDIPGGGRGVQAFWAIKLPHGDKIKGTFVFVKVEDNIKVIFNGDGSWDVGWFTVVQFWNERRDLVKSNKP